MKGKKPAQTARITPEQLAKNVNAKYKAPLIHLSTETNDPKIVKRPTGIASLDLALGGGFPGGTLNALSGKESVGKDALLNRIIRFNQKTYGNDSSIFMVYAESGGFDKIWARAHGVKVSLSDSEIADYEAASGFKVDPAQKAILKQQIGHFQIASSAEAEKMFQTALEYGDSGAASLIIINSLNTLLPFANLENPDIEPVGVGLKQASLLTEFSKKWGNWVGKHSRRPWYPTLIATQQARANVQTMRSWGSKNWTTNTGAHAFRHYKIMDVELQMIETLKEHDEAIGKKVRWTLTKAKHGTHDGIQGIYDLYFTSGPDEFEDIVAALTTNSMLKLEPGGICEGACPALNGIHMPKPDLISKFRSDPELFDLCYTALMKTLRVPFLTRERE